MEALELLEIISLGETSTVQFKRTIDHSDKVAQELCAFANSQGGMILFGVEDDGEISGLSPEEVRSLTSLLANVATQVIREPVYPSSEVVLVENKRVLVVRVAESASKPHFDKNGAIWVKALADKRRVTSREELRRIFQDAHVFYANEEPVARTSLADLDLDTFEAFQQKFFHQSIDGAGIGLDRLAQNHNVTANGRLTLAGLLFFGRNPQQFRPELLTKAVAWHGIRADTAEGYHDSEELTGTLPDQLAKALAFLHRNLIKPQKEQGINSQGEAEIMDQVFEELLVNMLVHRNYFLTAPQTVFLFPDRIEVQSPGHLPNKLTLDQAKAGNSIPRNPILQSLASKLMPYRGIGTGIPRALRLHPEIDFHNEVEENRFRSVVWRPV